MNMFAGKLQGTLPDGVTDVADWTEVWNRSSYVQSRYHNTNNFDCMPTAMLTLFALMVTPPFPTHTHTHTLGT